MTPFATNLQRAMRAKGVTNTSLAKLCGITHQTIGFYFGKGAIPGAATLRKLAAALGTTTDALLAPTEEGEPYQWQCRKNAEAARVSLDDEMSAALFRHVGRMLQRLLPKSELGAFLEAWPECPPAIRKLAYANIVAMTAQLPKEG